MNETNLTENLTQIAKEESKNYFDTATPLLDKLGDLFGNMTGYVVQKGVESGIIQNQITAKLVSIIILFGVFFLAGKITNKLLKYGLIVLVFLLIASILVSIFV